MTREQIKEAEAVMQRCRVGTHRLDIAHDILVDCYGTIGLLLAAAERALLLEDVLAAANEVREDGALCDKARNCDSCDALRAAIDRAEGKS